MFTDAKAVTFDLAASTIKILMVRNCAELMNDILPQQCYFPMMESRRSCLGMWQFLSSFPSNTLHPKQKKKVWPFWLREALKEQQERISIIF
jgi:hypothetical protein